jgi:hypothetical protein
MKKPGTKLGKLVAVDNRENTFGEGYYNGNQEHLVGSRESGVWGNQGGIEPQNIEQVNNPPSLKLRRAKGILNDEGREMATKALRRKVTQRISSQAHLRKYKRAQRSAKVIEVNWLTS